jgi:hypothetical protein
MLDMNERRNMVEQAEVLEEPKEPSKEIQGLAAKRAGERARVARWDLNVAVFLFAVLIIVIILLFQGIGVEVVAPVALFGLAMVWLVGWRRGRQLYEGYYNEELETLQRELARTNKLEGKESTDQTMEETIEEKVQKALRERWR